MKKTVVHRVLMFIALVALIMCSLFTVLNSMENTSEIPATGSDKMFKTVESYGSYGSVIVDQDTGVMYYRSNNSYGRGILTLLVDAEGNPKTITE